jgi:tRNA (mo5U34)-methyltransferase
VARATIDPDLLRRRIAAVPVWYHTMELAPGIVTPGEFDMRPHVGPYGIPASLRGLSVLDVGASNGFFSFLFEQLGAEKVVAIELRSVVDHDVPRWYRDREVARLGPREIERMDREQLEAGFELAREALGSRVELRRHHVYELEAAMPGEFDLVFCSNLLHHLRDPVGALENMRAALKPGGRFILGCSCDMSQDASYAIFSGDLEWVMWWIISREAILRMCKLAGFEQVEWTGHFEFTPTRFPTHVGKMGVIHARAPAAARGNGAAR